MGRYVKINGELVPIADMGGESQSTNFVGTLADWEALTQEQKNAYDSVDLIDDFSDEITEELDALNDRVGVAENQISALSDGQLHVLTVTKTISGAANGYSEHLLDFTSSIPSGATVDSIICYLGPYGSTTQHPTIAQNGFGKNGKTTIWLYQFAAGTVNIVGNIFYHF